MGAKPDIGVVVLTHNRCEELRRTLVRMTGLPEQPRIIVVDSGSRDRTAAVVRCFPGVDSIGFQRNVGAAGRNAGLQMLESPFAALCDDDTSWEPGSLRRAVNILRCNPKMAVVTARIEVGDDRREDPTSRLMRESPLKTPAGFPGQRVLGFMAGACVVRREAFLAAGGFEPRYFLGGEEELVTLRLAAAGWQLGYCDELLVRHWPSRVRDASGRRELLVRNQLWTAWAQRRWGTVVRRTASAAAEAAHDAEVRRAFVAAARGLPWAIANRRQVTKELEAELRLLEAQRNEFESCNRSATR